jgi:hypothetical protein
MTDGMKTIDLAVSPEAMKTWLKDKAKSSQSKGTPKKHKRKSGFEAKYTQLSTQTEKQLYAAGVNRHVYHLVHVILHEPSGSNRWQSRRSSFRGK